MRADEAMKTNTTMSIRFPGRLVRQLRITAKSEHRSINGLVVHLLDRALSAQSPTAPGTQSPDLATGGAPSLASQSSSLSKRGA